MLSVEDRCRVSVVLVRARNPNNIGAVARAMHDFGFGELRLVGDYWTPLESARSAIDAGEILRGARTFGDVGEAVADCTLVLATTAVGERALEHPVATLAQAGERVAGYLAADAAHRVGLLFGSEKTGLSNEELSHCHGLVTIPMETYAGVRHPSMNLGQAAAVCLYELVRERAVERLPGEPERARAGETERLRALLMEGAAGFRLYAPASGKQRTRRRCGECCCGRGRRRGMCRCGWVSCGRCCGG